ncbi:hypothetical protein J4419_02930 [Candidatus Woesearchaeota archaeon]|nr:hypothetical protein [Candidatus Woesearchaeota archaeon]
MKRMNSILREINASIGRIDFFFVLLKTLVLYTLCTLTLFLVRVSIWYALIPAAAYFFSSIAVQARFDRVRRIEERFPDLNEKLRTARDYKDRESMVLDSLEDDVVTGLKQVELKAFLPQINVWILVLALIFSVSATLYLASSGVKILDFSDVMDAARESFNQANEEEIQEGQFTGTEESFMQVGEEKIAVEITPIGSELDFSEVTDPQATFSTSFPKEAFISSGAAYESEFTEDQQLLIKRYFERRRT